MQLIKQDSEALLREERGRGWKPHLTDSRVGEQIKGQARPGRASCGRGILQPPELVKVLCTGDQ